jgi:predicted PurR-regulated permease PerM
MGAIVHLHRHSNRLFNVIIITITIISCVLINFTFHINTTHTITNIIIIINNIDNNNNETSQPISKTIAKPLASTRRTEKRTTQTRPKRSRSRRERRPTDQPATTGAHRARLGAHEASESVEFGGDS